MNVLRYSKKEFFLRCKFDGTYDFRHLACKPINCILEEVHISKTIKFPDDVVFVDRDWNKNSAVLEQKDLSDIVSVSVTDRCRAK